MIQLRKKLLVF